MVDFFSPEITRGPKQLVWHFPSAKSKELSKQDHLSSKNILQGWRAGLPWWLSGKESACQCRRHGLDLWSGEDPTCLGATKSAGHSYWAHALEPRSCNYLAHTPQLVKPTGPRARASPTREVTTVRSLCITTRKWPHSPQLEKNLHGNRDPAQQKLSIFK